MRNLLLNLLAKIFCTGTYELLRKRKILAYVQLDTHNWPMPSPN